MTQNASFLATADIEATAPLDRPKLIVVDEDRNVVAAERGALESLGSQLSSADSADELADYESKR